MRNEPIEGHNYMSDNLYDLLMVEPTATQDEIKKSYRSLMKYYHPDLNQSSEPGYELMIDIYKRVTEAYDNTLSIPVEREIYDAKLSKVSAASKLKTSSLFTQTEKKKQQDKLKVKRSGSKDGSDLNMDITISFFDTLEPTNLTVRARQIHHCESCFGTGEVVAGSNNRCSTCNGSRTIFTERFGKEVEISCPSCTSSLATTIPCVFCEGRGSTIRIDRVTFPVEPGLTEGSKITVEGRGNPGLLDGKDGDLVIKVHVEQDDRFTIDGFNILTNMEMNFTEFIQGGRKTFKGPKDDLIVRVPPLSNPGDIVVLEGLGVPRIKSTGAGDIIITLNLRMPEANPDLIQTLREMGV